MNIKQLSITLADKIAEFIGSWTFIIIQSSILIIWVVMNIIGLFHFDPYPFILLNLFLSFEAAYATPLILMSSSRQGEKDREHLLSDIEIDKNSFLLLVSLQEIIIQLREEIHLDKKALANHRRLEREHADFKSELEEIKKLLQK
jgi:uncharacterized membrane protein